MKINKLTASFGKLNNETLVLDEGMNIICAPNESGKSTWCAFICAMLYGIDSAERAKGGHLPDKTKYAPWSGAPMQGSMELTCQLGSITISRTTRLKNAPMREFSAVYTGTSTPVEGLNGTNAGEKITGVTRDVFCRSAYVMQGGVVISSSSELEKRICAIVSTGDETVSYSDADEKLRRWLRSRRYNRRGLLPELEDRISDEREKLESMAGFERTLSALSDELRTTQEECAELELQVNAARQNQRRKSLDLFNTSNAELEQCRTEYENAGAELEAVRERLSRSPFDGTDPGELATQVRIDTDKAERLQELSGKVSSAGVLASDAGFAAAIVCGIIYLKASSLILLICAALAAVSGIILGVNYLRAVKDRADAEKACGKILELYGVSQVCQIKELYDEYAHLRSELSKAIDRKRTADERLVKAQSVMQTLRETTLVDLDFADGNTQAALLGKELNAKKQHCASVQSQADTLQGKLSGIGDPLVLRSDIAQCEDERRQLEDEYSAISLAVDVLKAADIQIQNRFSPALGRLAAQYMGEMTGGRYTDILVSRDFTATVKTDSDSISRESAYLSEGTVDQMYLAIRLAVCALAMNSSESCPLVIDDALVSFDEKRYDRAIELLSRLSEERQVILFTCR